MDFSWKDPHFLLKLITLILLLLAIYVIQMLGTWDYYLIVEALTNTSAIVILVLIISLIFFKSSKITEICFICVVLVMLIICCCLGVPRERRAYVTANNGEYYVVFNINRRNAYLGLTIPAIVLEVVDLVFYAILAIICLGILFHDDDFSVPRWLWLIYCTNTLTYVVILMTLLGNYVLEENCQLLDTIISVIGIPLYMFAGLAAVVRSALYVPADADRDSCELVLGIFFIVITSLMISQVVWSMYSSNQRVEEH